ncbi:MAG TPA: hypothetical protein VJ553_06200 [Candidatus Paceibacterota bacterium]|nr:hypothetical protein [Candidatus Paceibacterota bacterium]
MHVPLGAWMLLATLALFVILWLHNAWPRIRIYRLARRVEVPAAELASPDLQSWLNAVARQIPHRYRQLYDSAGRLVYMFEDSAGMQHAWRIRERLLQLSATEPTFKNAEELETILWLLEDHPKNPLEYSVYAGSLSLDVHRLQRSMRRLDRLQRLYGTKAPAC